MIELAKCGQCGNVPDIKSETKGKITVYHVVCQCGEGTLRRYHSQEDAAKGWSAIVMWHADLRKKKK